MTGKPEIRRDMQARRDAMGAEERLAACGYVCDQLLTVKLAEGAVIAGYSTIRSEVDITEALRDYAAGGNRVCLPRVTKPKLTLDFLEWLPGGELAMGHYNIAEPISGEVLTPEVVLLPLLAFDRAGYRLGYGAGHYDATLAELKKSNPKLLSIGIGFAFQEVDKLPHEAHDMPMDMIITDREVIRV